MCVLYHVCQIKNEMAKKQQTYYSQRDRENYTFHPGRQFHHIWETDPGDCALYALDHRQAALLRTMLAVFPKYHWVWGMPSPRSDWTAAQEQQWADISDFVEELEACLVSGCDLNEFINTQKRLIGAISGEVITVQEDGQDVEYDYSEIGLGPRVDAMSARFTTDNWIAPNENIADLLANSLFGRYIDPIPSPLAGQGMADILDEQIDVLHNRLRMTDSSIFNPLNGEKNITEALETLLRRDLLSDLEFLTPNIATIIEDTFNTGDQAVIALLKSVTAQAIDNIELPAGTALQIKSWIASKLDVAERLSTADILLMLTLAEGDPSKIKSLIGAIKNLDLQANITLNNYNGCGCEGDCDCEAETQTLTLDDLDCEDDTETVVDV